MKNFNEFRKGRMEKSDARKLFGSLYHSKSQDTRQREQKLNELLSVMTEGKSINDINIEAHREIFDEKIKSPVMREYFAVIPKKAAEYIVSDGSVFCYTNWKLVTMTGGVLSIQNSDNKALLRVDMEDDANFYVKICVVGAKLPFAELTSPDDFFVNEIFAEEIFYN